MSTEPQSPFPPLGATYAETQTGRTVRAPTLVRLAQMANVLASARPAKRAQITSAYPDGSTPRTYCVSYTRTSDAIGYLYLAAHQRFGVATDVLTINLTIRDGAGHSVLSSADTIPVGFRSTTPHNVAAFDISTLATGFLDLDALAVTLTDPDWSLEFAIALSHGSGSLVDLIEVWEMPRSIVDDADTYGLLTAAVMPGRPITSGPITSPSNDGIARLRQTLAGARLTQRTYAQECFGPDDTTAALVPRTASSSYAALVGLDEGGGTPISYELRVRKITGAAGGELARARFRYKVTGGGMGSLRVTTALGTHDLTGLTSATWAWSDWLAVSLKINGTGQIDTITLKGKTTAGTVYVSSIVLEENVT
jgi:hypothetical protein